MKRACYILPATVMLVGSFWLARQRDSIAEREAGTALLRQRLEVSKRRGCGPGRTAKHRTTPLDLKPVDWQEVAREFGRGGGGNLATTQRLDQALESMSVEELLAALDEIERQELSGRRTNQL